MLSLALAVTAIVPLTMAPSLGELTLTTGGTSSPVGALVRPQNSAA
jgi:hypothetical protein